LPEIVKAALTNKPFFPFYPLEESDTTSFKAGRAKSKLKLS